MMSEQAIEVQPSKTPAELILASITEKVDLDKVKGLLEIQERYEANQARKAYNQAMTDFKKNAPVIFKDRAVAFGTGKAAYKHATLFQVAKKVTEEMSKHGLTASWRVTQNGTISVTTRVSHVLGHYEETTLSAPSDTSGSKNPIQAIGSTVSYLERYGLMAICGLAAADQDDDAVGASEDVIDQKQVGIILDWIAESGADMTKFLNWLKVDSVENIRKTDYERALTSLTDKAKKKGAVK